MNGVQHHYDTLLGSTFEWSLSTSGDPFASATAWLSRHSLLSGGSYLDLGAGFGAHAIPLARHAKAVTAIEANHALASRLRDVASRERLDIDVVENDLLASIERAPSASWDTLLCLRDTLCLLEKIDDVDRFFVAAARVLKAGGLAVVSYRDTTTFRATGTARFLEVARDEKRVMHCLLEEIDPRHLRVTDILTEVGPLGPTTQMSDYVKLRIAPHELNQLAMRVGLSLENTVNDSGFVVQSWRRLAA